MPVRTMDKKVKGYLLWELQNYPETKQRLETFWAAAQHDKKLYQNSIYLQRMERTADAIGNVLQNIDPIQMDMLELIFWKKTHNAAGAGLRVGASERTVYRWVDQIVYAVGIKLGYWL